MKKKITQMNGLYRKPLIFGHHQRIEAEGHLETAAEDCIVQEKGIDHNMKVPNHPTNSSQMNDHFGHFLLWRAFVSQARARSKLIKNKKSYVLFISIHIPQDLPYPIMKQR